MLSQGAGNGYGTPQTLTDTGVKLAAGQQGDAPLLGPTLLVFAPAVKGGAPETLRSGRCRLWHRNECPHVHGCPVSGWWQGAAHRCKVRSAVRRDPEICDRDLT